MLLVPLFLIFSLTVVATPKVSVLPVPVDVAASEMVMVVPFTIEKIVAPYGIPVPPIVIPALRSEVFERPEMV